MENKQYLTFNWHNLQYGIEAALVQEIFPLPELTLIPDAPPDTLGILNLRGQLVPMMHLDLLQGHLLKNCNLSDYVIVVQWEGLQIGMIVHQVNEVLELNAEAIEPESYHELFGDINTAFIVGVAKADVDNILLLDPKTLIGQPDALLTLIWDAQSQLDLMAASPTSDVKQQPTQEVSQQSEEQYFSDKANLTPLTPLPYQGMGESISPLVAGEELGERLTEQQDEELQTPKTIPNFYDLYCPSATPEERAIFRQRADNLKPPIESLKVITELMPVAVIGLGNEYFGLALELVREFTDIANLTPIPCCPKHIVGNMNLRGEVVTLVDIRNILNLPTPPVSVGSDAVVVQVDDIVAGLPVDQVLEMVYLNTAEMTPLPTTPSDLGEQYLRGTAFFQEKTLRVLDLPKILTQGGLVVHEEA
jgi:purine-binding chemotaxis protein CheW